MTFDASRAKIVLFGGFATTSGALGDTWEFDGNTWTQVEDIGPDACFNAALVFKGGRCGLYGGASAPAGASPPPTIFSFSWEWDGAHWTAKQDIGPGPRVGHSMAYDSARQRIVLFGGSELALDGAQSAGSVTGETWEQYEVGASPSGPGPDPDGTEAALTNFEIVPAVAVPGDTLVFSVTLDSPAGAAGQTVTAIDQPSGASFDIFVEPGAISGQLMYALDPNLGSSMALPVWFDFEATSGGVMIHATLMINP